MTSYTEGGAWYLPVVIYMKASSFVLVLCKLSGLCLTNRVKTACILKRVLTNFWKRVWSIFMHLQSYGYQTARIILKEISEKKQ